MFILKFLFEKRKQIKGEPRVYYSLRKYKNIGSHDIMTDISEHVTIVKLMDSLGNVNRSISVVNC